MPTVVQQVKGESYAEYGFHAVEIATAAGHGIVVYAGWDRNFNPSPAPTPAVHVSDSAGNKWYHLGTSDAANSGARCSIWFTPGWQAVEWVSVSLTGYAASLAYLVAEISGMPSLSVTDVSVTSTSPAVMSTTVAAEGTASVSGIGFSVACAGSTATSLSSAPSGWTALDTVSAGGSAADGVEIWPYWHSSVSAGNVTASYGFSAAAPLAAALATIETSPVAPVPVNPQFPVLAVSLSLGMLPGDVSAAPPVGTDITLRCIGKDGDAWIDTGYGREYELAAPEAGTMTVGVRNNDGAFTPGNISSPYWSNALTANPGFETGTLAGWSPLNNASPAVQQGYVYDGGWSAQLTPDGVTAASGLAVAAVATGSRDYCASAWCLFPSAWAGGVEALIGWYSGATLLATTTGGLFTPAAGTWTQISVRASAFPGATSAVAYFEYAGGVPPATAVSYWDDGGLCPGGQTVQVNCVRDLTPVHVDAYWAGAWYDVGHGYVQAWPQEWPDLPQYGLSKMKAADALAVMASCTMPSAMQGEILIDNPYAYLTCGEQYLSFTTGLTGDSDTLVSAAFASAQFLQAANLSRTNQRYGVYVQASPSVQVQTGLALNLLGDQGTGMGATSYTGNPGVGAGPGVVYADPNLPSPQVAAGYNGVSLECWFVQDDTNEPYLLSAWASGSPYVASAAPDLLGGALSVIADGSTSQLTVFLPGTALVATYASSVNPQHVAVVLSPNASVSFPSPNWTAELWLNGALADSAAMTRANLLAWNAVTLGPARYTFGAVPFKGNYVLGHAAVHSSALAPSRVTAHYRVGGFGTVSGAAGDTPQQRLAAILCWGNLGIARGGPLTFHGATENVWMGPAYDVGGSSATDAAGVITTSEGGQLACMPSGVLTYLPRWWLYNQPSAVTFGDNSQAGEVPFLRGQAWDFDTTYLYDQVAATRVSGPTTSITATWRDTIGALRYFLRSALTQQVETTSDFDAYDASTWLANKYAEPALRVRSMTIDAAANPAQAFPAVLTTRQGTVATVSRRPVGGTAISTVVQCQKVSHRIGAGEWKTRYQLSPYQPDNSVLQLDTAGFDTLGGVAALPR